MKRVRNTVLLLLGIAPVMLIFAAAGAFAGLMAMARTLRDTWSQP